MTKRQAENEVHKCQQYGIGRCTGKGWHIWTYHTSGVMYAEELRPWYPTKREAIEAVRREERESA